MKRAHLVGHDLGAWVAAGAARLRPDLLATLALVSTVVGPREPHHPSAGWAALEAQRGARFYHHYFQQPGLAEAALDADIARSLRSIHHAISGQACPEERWRLFIGGAADPALPMMQPLFDAMSSQRRSPARAEGPARCWLR